MSKWLDFVLIQKKPKTDVFSVNSKDSQDRLGVIKWYPVWRHYCFFPKKELDAVYSDRCLQDISEFVSSLNNEHKKRKELKP